MNYKLTINLTTENTEKVREKLKLSVSSVLSVVQLFILLFTVGSLLAEEPWGKDAGLARPIIIKEKAPCQTLVFGPLAEALITFHQQVISPADGPRSHYYPSSSQYMLDAIRKYGFFEGFFLGCDRLMRENNDPWIYRTIILPDGSCLKSNAVP